MPFAEPWVGERVFFCLDLAKPARPHSRNGWARISRFPLYYRTVRIRFEKNPALLAGQIESLGTRSRRPPLVFLDEIQRAPQVMDVVQHLIDRKMASFILTGSSARKLRRGPGGQPSAGPCRLNSVGSILAARGCEGFARADTALRPTSCDRTSEQRSRSPDRPGIVCRRLS